MAIRRCAACELLKLQPTMPDPDTDWADRCEVCGQPLSTAGAAPSREEQVAVDPPRETPPPPPVAASLASAGNRSSNPRFPSVLLMIQEMLYARRASRDMMLWHARVLMEDPGLHGRSLYQRVLIRRNSVDAMAADRILRRAEQSQGNWESDRDLRYQDVVLYVIVEEYLRRHPSRLGARANMERVVARNVARHL